MRNNDERIDTMKKGGNCMKCLVFGSLNIDHTYSVDHILKEKETSSAQHLEDFCGGKGLNQAVALRRAGMDVSMGGCIGSGSEILTSCMQNDGIDASLLRKLDCANGHAIIQIDQTGQNSILVYPGSNHQVTLEQISQTLHYFTKGDILVAQNETNYVQEILKEAHDHGLVVAWNPSPIPNNCKQLPLHDVDYLFINEVEGAAICGSEDPDQIQAYFHQHWPLCHVVLTLGEKGSRYQYQDERAQVCCCQVEVVDTVGAGDTFMGYFLSGMSEGKTPQTCLELASVASACAVGKAGAVASIPYRKQVDALLQQSK